MNKFRFLIKFIFILYSFALTTFLYYVFIENSYNNSIKELNPCENIDSITSQENKIFINFKQKITNEYNPYHFSKHFSFQTKAFNQKFLFFYDSFIDTSCIKNNKVFEIILPFPFIQNYSVSLYCHNIQENINNSINSQQILYQKQFHVSLTDFQPNVFTSQMKCDGNDINNRVCEASNITILSNSIIFNSPVHFNFTKNFINLGSRNLIFEKNSIILSDNMIVKNNNFYSNIVDFVPREKLIFILSESKEEYLNTFFNRLIDLYYPLYKTIEKYKDRKLPSLNENDKENELVFLEMSFSLDFDPFILKLLNNKYYHVQNTKFGVLVEHSIIGLVKIDKNQDIHQFADQFNSNNVPIDSSFVQYLNNLFKSNESHSNNQNEINITIINQPYYPLNVQNLTACENISILTCQRYNRICNIHYYDFSINQIEKIIHDVQKSNILITRAFYGSELCLWMKKGGYLLNLYPDFMICDKRIEKLAEISEIELRRLDSIYSYSSDECVEKECSSSSCYSQSITHPIDIYHSQFGAILDEIISTF